MQRARERQYDGESRPDLCEPILVRYDQAVEARLLSVLRLQLTLLNVEAFVAKYHDDTIEYLLVRLVVTWVLLIAFSSGGRLQTGAGRSIELAAVRATLAVKYFLDGCDGILGQQALAGHLFDLLLADSNSDVGRLRHPALPLFLIVDSLHNFHNLAAHVLLELL